MITVYLAGNMHQDWRMEVKVKLDEAEKVNKAIRNKEGNSELYFLAGNVIRFLEPFKTKNSRAYFQSEEGKNATLTPQESICRDLLWIDKADIVFGYITEYGEYSRSVGLSAEVGYAKGCDKRIILVDDTSIDSFTFLHEMADCVFDSLDKGIEYLSMLSLHWG